MPTTLDRVIPFRRGAGGDYEINAADLFCGAGGTSTGMVQAVEKLQAAFGIKINLNLVAVNHWPVAIETHSENHKFAQHRCSGLKGVNPRDVIPGALDLLVASPECTHHSNARGGKPMDDQSRSSGDDVVRWIRLTNPAMVLIENVREYRSWGPLDETNRPIKERKGEYFQRFLSEIRALGYSTDDRLLCAADYGDPTTRIRLFVICRRGGGPVRFPAQTHAKDPGRSLIPGLKPWRAAREIIDWKDRGTSIFNRKKPLQPKTMRRIAAGLKKFSGIDIEEFLVKLYGTSTAASAGLPAPTVTGSSNHLFVAQPFISNVGGPEGQGRQPQSVEGPMGTIIGENHRAVIQPEAFAVTLTHQDAPGADPGTRVRGVGEPLPVVTGANRGELALVTPFAEALNGAVFSGKIVVAVEMVRYTHNALAMDPQNCLLITFADGSRILLDIYFRMFKVRELARAQGFPESYKFKGTTSDAVKQVGNAVPVGIAEALCYESFLQMDWGHA